MNITCDQCGKRYKMKAQQTKKAFKTRCKRCSNVIIVRPEELQLSAEAQSQNPVAAESSNASWYAVIDGQQNGPFTHEQLRGYLANGSLDAESFVWREGMSNWEPLAQISELSDIIHQQATPHPVTSAPMPEQVIKQSANNQDEPPVKGNPTSTKSSGVDTQEPERASDHQAMSMGVQIGHDRALLAQVKSQELAKQEVMFSSENASTQGDSASASLTNQRNENSVLFSLDSIDGMSAGGIDIKNAPVSSMASQPVARPMVTNTGGSDGSGLIDLSALSSIRTPGNGAASTGPVPINLTAGVKRVGGGRSLTNRSTDLKTVALAICSTALVLVIGFIGYQKMVIPQPAQQQPISLGNPSAINPIKPGTAKVNSPVATKVAIQKNVKTIPADPTDVKAPKAVKSSTKSSASGSKKSKRSSKSTSRRSKAKERASRRRNKTQRRSSSRKAAKSSSSRSKKSEATALLSNLNGGKRKSSGGGLSAITGSSKPKKTGPKKPSKSSITKAMRRVNLGSCLGRDPSLKGKGRIKVRIVAISSGAIKTARVLNSPFKSSPVGACLEREVRRQRFPAFTDPDISFTFPFKN